MGRSMAGGESRGTFTQNSTRENVKTGNLNPIYERLLTKLGAYQKEEGG